MIGSKTMTDATLSAIEKIGRPASTSEIFAQVDIAEDIKQVSNALHRLKRDGMIRRDDAGLVVIQGVTINAAPVDIVPAPVQVPANNSPSDSQVEVLGPEIPAGRDQSFSEMVKKFGWKEVDAHFDKATPATIGEPYAPSRRKQDAVDHPEHYNSHPSGIECIEITEHMNFCLGNAIKYIWRADEKGAAIEDLKKARWYLDREIERRARHQIEDGPLVVVGQPEI